MKLGTLSFFALALSISLHSLPVSAGVFDDASDRIEQVIKDANGLPSKRQRIEGFRQHSIEVTSWIETIDAIDKAQDQFAGKMRSLRAAEISNSAQLATIEASIAVNGTSPHALIAEFENVWSDLKHETTPLGREMEFMNYNILLNRLAKQNSVSADDLLTLIAAYEVSFKTSENSLKTLQVYRDSLRAERAELGKILHRDLAEISLANE